jgi:hypothetical protein
MSKTCDCEKIIEVLRKGQIIVEFQGFDNLEAYFGELPSVRVSDCLGLDVMYLMLQCPKCKKRFRIKE